MNGFELDAAPARSWLVVDTGFNHPAVRGILSQGEASDALDALDKFAVSAGLASGSEREMSEWLFRPGLDGSREAVFEDTFALAMAMGGDQ